VRLAALRGESASFRELNLIYLRNDNQNEGAVLTGKKPDYSGEVSEQYRLSFLSDRWNPDPIKARYFRRLVELAAANGVRVYWLITPFAPALQDGRDARKLDAPYDAFARAMTAKYPQPHRPRREAFRLRALGLPGRDPSRRRRRGRLQPRDRRGDQPGNIIPVGPPASIPTPPDRHALRARPRFHEDRPGRAARQAIVLTAAAPCPHPSGKLE